MRLLPLLVIVIACSGGAGPGNNGGPPPPVCVNTFVNPVATQGQDPWVVRHQGSYYLIESRNGGIWVSRSDKLSQPRKNSVMIWSPPSTGWNRENIWAPELHLIDGKWYVYYAAGPSGTAPATFVNQRSFVLESTGADPQGTYVDRGMLYTGDDFGGAPETNKWSIDLTVARLGGQLYAVWSGWEFNNTQTDRTPQHLYIARMSGPTAISSNRVRISSPDAPWERGTELDLQEGPELLERNGQTFIIYSARESWLREYKLGQLRLLANADPMKAASWEKSGPVFAGTEQVYGVGHASFTKSPDGTEDWIVYHSKISTTPGWDRDVRIQKFGWNADGSPSFGVPIPAGSPQVVPSGECPS